MKMIKQEGPDCLITSAAMVLDCTVKELKDDIPANSLDFMWTFEEVPNHLLRRRGYHMQEIIDVFWTRGYALTVVEMFPRMAPSGYDQLWKLAYPEQDCVERFVKYLDDEVALLHGETKSQLPHTVAWDGKNIYNPNGQIQELKDFRLREAWIAKRFS